MLYLLLQACKTWLIEHDLYRFAGVLDQLQFRSLVAAAISFLIVLGLGRRTIAWLVRKKIGDTGLTDSQALQATSNAKANTPTMGGILIVGAIVGSVVLLGNLREMYVLLSLVVVLWLALLGGVDDWLKLTAKTRGGGRQGLYAWEKLVFQLGLGLLVGYFLYTRPPAVDPSTPGAPADVRHVLNLPFQKTYVDADRLRPVQPREADASGPTAAPPESGARVAPREREMVVNPSVLMLGAPLFVLIATPLVSAVIHRLRKQEREPATGGKVIAGLFTTVAAFVVLSVVSRQVRADHKVAFIWFGLTMALISTGELLVVPMMQSLLGKLAPRSAFTTAFLFVAMSIGYTLGGWVGTLYERLSAVVFWGVCAGLVGVAGVGMMWFRNSGDDS